MLIGTLYAVIMIEGEASVNISDGYLCHLCCLLITSSYHSLTQLSSCDTWGEGWGGGGAGETETISTGKAIVLLIPLPSIIIMANT